MRKDIFIEGHERPDVVEDQNRFLTKIEELKSYMVEFNEDGVMKAKDYPVDCIVEDEECRPIIIINHNEYIFFANNGVQKAWTWERDIFLQPKGWGQGIITSNFLLSFGRLNLASLSSKKKKEIEEKCSLLETEVVEMLNMEKITMGIRMEPNYINK